MLEKLKNAGINTISSYIPWSWHEFSENIFDFDGHTHPRRDLISFLELLKKYDFYFIARPGPYIYAEFKGYGVPDWVRKKYPEVLMLSEKKQPLTEVALTHPTFTACRKVVSPVISTSKEIFEEYRKTPLHSIR